MKSYSIQHEKDAIDFYKNISLSQYSIYDYNDLYSTYTRKAHVCFKNIDILMFLYYYILDNEPTFHRKIAFHVFSKRHVLDNSGLKCVMHIPIPIKQTNNIWAKLSSLFIKRKQQKYKIQ